MSPQSLSRGKRDALGDGAYDLIITDADLVHKPKNSQGTKKIAKPLWSDFGFVGEIGYSIAVPIVLGALVGAFLDKSWVTYPRGTLSGIAIGVLLSFATLFQTVKKVLEQSRSH